MGAVSRTDDRNSSAALTRLPATDASSTSAPWTASQDACSLVVGRPDREWTMPDQTRFVALLFPNVTQLDLTGPVQLFSWM